MPTTTTTTTTPLFKSFLWTGTSDYTINEVSYNSELVSNGYSETLTTPISHILLAEDENKMYITCSDKIYQYAVDYCQSESQVGLLLSSTNSNKMLISNYFDGYVWAVQSYNGKISKMNPSDLSIVKNYTDFDSPFKIVKSEYHNAYFVAGTHILWKIDRTTDKITTVYSINGYSIADFDISESGVICLLFSGSSGDTVRILKNDIYSLLLSKDVVGNLRYCKYCGEGRFYFLSELNRSESYTYLAENYLYNVGDSTLKNYPFDGNILVTTTTTTLGTTTEDVEITYPVGGEQFQKDRDYDIKWLSAKSTSDYVKIELYKSNEFYVTINEKVENSGIYGWKIPTDIVEDTDYKVKITWLSVGSGSFPSVSEESFSILNTVPITTTTTTTLVSQMAIGVDYDSDIDKVIVVLGSGLFMTLDLSDRVVTGLIDSEVKNVTCFAARTAKVRTLGVQNKVRIFVGTSQYLADKWDSGIIETSLTSAYYGGGNNLKPGERYYVHIQTCSEKNGWGQIQVKSFVMPKQ